MAAEKHTNQIEDQELNDLLDSALNDFNKEQKANKEDASKIDASESATDKNTIETFENSWTMDFVKDAAEQFEENLQNLIKHGTDNELGASSQRIAQTIASAITEEDNVDKENTSTDFQSAIARALNDLSARSENLQSEVELSEMLEQASLEDGPDAILSFMQGMLQHLLSKEIFYPSLKKLVDNYPEWLEEKKSMMSSSDLERFTKQLELMRQICTELEKEKDEDTEEIKRKRFEMVVSLMEEVQGCGQLPKDLVPDQTMPFEVNAEGDPIISALYRGKDSPQNCCLM